LIDGVSGMATDSALWSTPPGTGYFHASQRPRLRPSGERLTILVTVVGPALIARLTESIGKTVMLWGITGTGFSHQAAAPQARSAAIVPVSGEFAAWFQTEQLALRGDLGSAC
jgi:hypothetical protein